MTSVIPTTGALESGITEEFSFVFYEGLGGFSALVPYPWPISIGGRPFLIDLEHYSWSLPDMVRQAVDFSSSPGEQSFDTGGVWLRTSGDWSLGAGQEYHDANDANQRMFAESLGIDPWTKRQITLLPDTDLLAESTSSVLLLLPFAQSLYLLDSEGQSLSRTINPQNDTPTITPITGFSGTNLLDITTDGGNVYVAAQDGIYTHDPMGTTATVFGGAASTTVANLLEFANGWLVVGVDNVLSSIDSAGALTEITAHRVGSFLWAAVVGAPSGIYAGGQGDDVAEIVHIGLDDTTGGLAVPVHAGELPRGEYVRSLAYYGSVILIGTSKGFRVAQINGDVNATLDIGPLIDTGSSVLNSFGDSKFVWFGWTNYDDGHTGVGRANLAEFRSRQQPAYASDLMALDQGTVSDVCRFDEHTYFAVAGSGFYREQPSGNVVPSGTVRLGKTEWGTFEPKTFLGLALITRPLEGSVSATLTDDADNELALGTLNRQGTTGLGQVIGAGQSGLSTYFDVTLTLTAVEDLTAAPVVRLVTSRALVVPHQIQRWVLPIVCKDKVRVGQDDNVEASQDVAEIRDYFIGLRRTGTPVAYQEGTKRHLVVVRDVSFPEGTAERWGNGREGLQGLLLVTVDSIEQ